MQLVQSDAGRPDRQATHFRSGQGLIVALPMSLLLWLVIFVGTGVIRPHLGVHEVPGQQAGAPSRA